MIDSHRSELRRGRLVFDGLGRVEVRLGGRLEAAASLVLRFSFGTAHCVVVVRDLVDLWRALLRLARLEAPDVSVEFCLLAHMREVQIVFRRRVRAFSRLCSLRRMIQLNAFLQDVFLRR